MKRGAVLCRKAWMVAAVAVSLILSVSVGSLPAAEPGIESDRWTRTRLDGGVTFEYSADGTEVTVIFAPNPEGLMPRRQSADLAAGSESAESPFVGDYLAAGVDGATFTVLSDGHVPFVHVLYFRSAGPYLGEYRHEFDGSGEAGAVVTNRVSLTDKTGWDSAQTLTDERWEGARRHVAEIGVRLRAPATTPGERYTVGAFKLFGDGFETPPADLRPFIRQIAGKAQLIRLRWSCAKGRSYTVLRAGEVNGPFEPVPGMERILAETDGAMEREWSVEQGEARRFFKIKAE